MDIKEIARVCHEVNRDYCSAVGDPSQERWEDAPEWQRLSAVSGVEFHLAHQSASPSASHENWLAQKLAEGWVYGDVKNFVAKTHPCVVPFESLPKEQQIKDWLFRAIVHALKDS